VTGDASARNPLSTGHERAAAKWVEAYLFGDRRTHEECAGWILAVIRHRAWRLPADAEDLLQEVRLRLVESFEKGSFHGISSPKTYVQSVAKHACLDALRRAKVREALPFSEEQFPSSRDEPSEALAKREDARLCYEVLMGLPAHCRRLFQWILVEELTYEEMARRQSVAVGTVKSRLARCRDHAVSLRQSALGRGRR
jgi:RNA polymerase sigma-70 factor (ECF subfamily)